MGILENTTTLFLTILLSFVSVCVPAELISVAGTEQNCTACLPGFFASLETPSCNVCKDLGHPGSCMEITDCTMCRPGSASNVTGAIACEECLPGYAQIQPGQKECLPCDQGYFTNNNGSAECRPCGTGYISQHSASTNCLACQPGTFNPFPNATICKECPAGQFQPLNGSGSCRLCDDGSVCGTTGCTSCMLCKMGWSAVGMGNKNCTACGPGTYKPMAGSGSCLQCPAGYYTLSNETAAIECTICPEGYYCQCPICLPERCIIPSQCPPGTSHYIFCPTAFLQPPANPNNLNCDLSILSIILISIAAGLVGFPFLILIFRLVSSTVSKMKDIPTESISNQQHDGEYNPILMAGGAKENKKKFGAL